MTEIKTRDKSESTFKMVSHYTYGRTMNNAEEIDVDDFLELWKSFDIDANIEEVVNEDPDAITIFNKQQLYNHGLGADGNYLRGYRNPKYAEEKNKMNSNPGMGMPDIFLTGETFNQMWAKLNKNELTISSNTPQTPKLEADRPNIFGLDSDSEDKAAEEIIEPQLQQKMTEKIGVDFI